MNLYRSLVSFCSSLTLLLFAFALLSVGSAQAQAVSSMETEFSDLKLWYNQPAPQWNHALPVGNGRLGAMVFGETAAERIQLNEETFWAGGPYDPTNPGGQRRSPKSSVFCLPEK